MITAYIVSKKLDANGYTREIIGKMYGSNALRLQCEANEYIKENKLEAFVMMEEI